MKKKQTDEKLQVEFHWEKYLEVMGIDKEKMSEDYEREVRRGFYGGFGMCLICLRNVVGAMDDELHAMNALENMHEQVLKYMKDEYYKQQENEG